MIPIKIQANDSSTLKIIWQITTACTYACEYCPKELHTGSNETLNLKDFEKFLDLFKDRKIVMTITGGEPTVHPQFVEIARLLKTKGIKTVVDSNLSRSTRFYTEVADLIDNWCVTLHPYKHELDLEKIKTLAEKSFTVVYVMMDPKYWSKAMAWWKELRSVENIKLTILKPVDNWSGANYQGQFTEEEQMFLNSTTPIYTFTENKIKEVQQNYAWLSDLGSTVTWNDNSSQPLDADMIMKQGLNKFKGWDCYAGREVMVLDNQGNVSLATCGVANLGHWSTVNINDVLDPVVCPKEICHCGTDIKATKFKNEVL